jgi:hypothetical protein
VKHKMQRLAAELQFSSRWRLATLEHRLLVSGLCGVMCLLIAGPALGVENRFDGAYIGKTTLTKGFGPMCRTNDNVSVDIHGKTLTFTNSRLQSFVMSSNTPVVWHPDTLVAQAEHITLIAASTPSHADHAH